MKGSDTTVEPAKKGRLDWSGNNSHGAGVNDGETAAGTRRWSGYVCPACRLVFKVPVDHGGRGVVCPSCRRLLRLPAEGEVAPPLVAASVTDEDEVEQLASGVGRRMRLWHSKRSRKRQGEGGFAWERAGRGSRFGEMNMQKTLLWLGVGLVVFALIVMVSVRMTERIATRPNIAKEAVQTPLDWGGGAPPPSSSAEATGAAQAPRLSAEEQKDKSVVGAMTMDPARTLAATEEVAKRFLAAKSADEMLPIVRHRAVTEPRLRDWYRRQPPQGEMFRDFGTKGGMVPSGKLVAITLEMDDFSTREMVFEQTPDGFLFDWESWVGWSEIPWEEFLRARPTTPKEFRVTVQRGEYYNFGFADDGKYQCYVLTAPYRDDLLFGYVARGSALDEELNAGCAGDKSAWVLQLAYPPDAKAANQVIIAKILAKGWVSQDPSHGSGP